MSGSAKAGGSDSRFKKGKSGNPRGRPYGSQNILTILRRELARRVTITVDGVSKRLTVRDALEYILVNGYSRGSLAHVKLVTDLELVDKHEPLIIEMSELERLL